MLLVSRSRMFTIEAAKIQKTTKSCCHVYNDSPAKKSVSSHFVYFQRIDIVFLQLDFEFCPEEGKMCLGRGFRGKDNLSKHNGFVWKNVTLAQCLF